MLDTNVLISALLWTGTPHEVLIAVLAGGAALVASPSLIDEVRDVLARPKLASRIALLGTSADEMMESLLRVVEIIEEPTIEPVIAKDPEDDRVLACAVAGNASWIVSGDSHLLTLKRYKRVSILTPAEVLKKLPSPA